MDYTPTLRAYPALVAGEGVAATHRLIRHHEAVGQSSKASSNTSRCYPPSICFRYSLALQTCIYRLCLDGVGFGSIAAELNERGIPGPVRDTWGFTTVKAILENPTYRGDLVWNRRTDAKFYRVNNGRTKQRKRRAGEATQSCRRPAVAKRPDRRSIE